jgi:deazaflavin-dependent oxidoreductase (nitroreductase family)
MSDFNQQVIEEFRANSGVVGGPFTGRPLLLLTTTGAKSGRQIVTPLMYVEDGDRYVIVASKGGAPTNPAWYYNIRANPTVELEIGDEKFAARATVAEEPERTRLYNIFAQNWQFFADYQTKTERVIPAIVLERI